MHQDVRSERPLKPAIQAPFFLYTGEGFNNTRRKYSDRG